MTHLTDKALIENLINPSYLTFDQMYEKYWDLLLHVALKKTGDIDVAMDIVQDLFVDIWQRRMNLQINSSVRNYLISSLYFKIFMHFRKKGVQERHIEHYLLLKETEQNEDTFASEKQETAYEQLIQVIEESVDDMPERMREVFNLKYYRSLSNQEIADCLGISLQTVKNQLSRSLTYIRRNIPKRHLDPTIWALLTFIFT